VQAPLDVPEVERESEELRLVARDEVGQARIA
jgi:hypothetical protein